MHAKELPVLRRFRTLIWDLQKNQERNVTTQIMSLKLTSLNARSILGQFTKANNHQNPANGR